MRIWLVPALVVAGLLWAWWAKRQMQQRHMTALIRAARGDAARARRVTFVTELGAAVLATAAIVAAFVAEGEKGWWWLRISLALLVIVIYVPYTMTLGEVRVRLKVRKPPQERMIELGASHAVATEIARVGRPFAYYGSLALLASVIAFLWHLFGR